MRLAALALTALFAGCGQNGRYQIVMLANGDFLKLDTQSGEIKRCMVLQYSVHCASQ